MDTEFLKMLAVSIAVGGLLGVERELKAQTVAGMRTFMLASMLGMLSVFISEVLGERYFILIAFSGIILITILVGIIKNYKLDDVGVTTPVALPLAFMLGILVGKGYFLESAASSIIITGILISKKYSKEFSETLTQREIINALQFGLIVFVLYPVVPSETIFFLNLKILILVIILVASIGFAGFIALKKVGAERGLPIIGALGGLVNSEATTNALAARAREKEELTSPAMLGVVLTNVVMLGRNLVIAGFISLAVLKLMLLPQLAMIAVGMLYSYFLKPRKGPKDVQISLESPFAIIPAVKFAALFSIISLAVNYLKDFGAGSVYIAAALGGLVSSAAVTASLASLGTVKALDLSVAASGCVLSAVGSTFGKLIISRISGSPALTRELSKPMLAVMFIGLITLFLSPL
ncbi:MAG: MgtC/SapB family protein [Candidatus Hydrothermarchaeota archaeon]|nr:MgtC/SapB family protein [Candidatus Hydrothermarchaeota archaeon]